MSRHKINSSPLERVEQEAVVKWANTVGLLKWPELAIVALVILLIAFAIINGRESRRIENGRKRLTYEEHKQARIQEILDDFYKKL